MPSLWRLIKNQIVQEIPEEIALCEFDCHKQQCTEKEWSTCPRRIGKAAGELMPESKGETKGKDLALSANGCARCSIRAIAASTSSSGFTCLRRTSSA